MRTIAYVDGYNFYHGLLKHTNYKWLDLRALMADVLRSQDPESELINVKFFTAMIKAALARRKIDSTIAQDAYHRALALRGCEVILGQFTLSHGSAPRYVQGTPADRDDRCEIWALGEKQTDVKVALQMYRDASLGQVDQIVLCTNDSDLSPSLAAIREDFPHIRIGVILPRPPSLTARKSGTLEGLAHWTRHAVREEELAKHQLPNRIPTRKKPIDKPSHW
ncbi:NYN domain-containing protein [Solimonas sp. SE-A11]|uniref:NYN domain-containing protein n=1 Tax=Solimonas sp. SE-A11 TaxID=3054954 RepID=UPI00259D1D91|nr:NYN domain-containing protein [Solimonas sp. SE-A11]MDM4772873.1 NYN domain-containing protein [Solimonas sp. SE-A11]